MKKKGSGRPDKLKRKFDQFRGDQPADPAYSGPAPDDDGPIPVGIDIQNLFGGSGRMAAPTPPPPTRADVHQAQLMMPAAGGAPYQAESGMARLVEENKTLRKLSEVFTTLSAEMTLEGFFETAVDLAMALSKTEDAFLASVGHQGFEIFALKAYGDQALAGQDLQIAENLSRLVFEKGLELVVADYQSDPRFQQMPRGQGRLRAMLIVPLVFKRRVLAVVFLGNGYVPGAYTERDRVFYTGFGQQAAIVLANLLLHEEREQDVRQLRTELDQAHTAIQKKDVQIEDLQKVSMTALFELPLKQAETKFFQKYLKNGLDRNGGDIDLAAREVGVAPNNYVKLLKEHGLNIRHMSEEEARSKAEEMGVPDKKGPVVRRGRRRLR